MLKIIKMSFFLLATSSLSVGAALPPAAKPQPDKIMFKSGVQTGGIAGSGFTLMDMKKTALKDRERLIIDIGDLYGDPIKGAPGYFHVQVQDNPSRVVIDFAQMQSAKMDESMINKSIAGSPYVKSAKLLLDPEEKTTSLILDLKKNVKVKVYQVPGSKTTSKVVLDFLQ